MDAPDDDALRELIEASRRIAVVGIKADPDADAHRVPRYLQGAGHRILPVSPKLREVLGEPCAATLGEVAGPVDLVNLFRAPAHIAAHTDEILALDPLPTGVWMQLGIRDDASAERLRARGITVVQGRCLLVEHRRLLGVRA